MFVVVDKAQVAIGSHGNQLSMHPIIHVVVHYHVTGSLFYFNPLHTPGDDDQGEAVYS